MKSKLLNTEYFEDNEFLDKYIDLILNHCVAYEKFKTSKHHIIPVSYYKICGLAVNNDSDNLVTLTNSNHLLAHYYLAKCTKHQLQIKMILAFNYMIRQPNKYTLPNISESEIYNLDFVFRKILSDNAKNLHSKEARIKAKETLFRHYGVYSISQLPEVKIKISKAKTGISTITEKQRNILRESARKQWTGTHHSDATKNKISKSLQGHTVSEETRYKISESCKGNKPPNAGRLAVYSYKTTFISIDGMTYLEVLEYLNKNHLNLGSYIKNKNKRNIDFILRQTKEFNKLNNLKRRCL